MSGLDPVQDKTDQPSDDGEELEPLPLTEHSRDELADMSTEELKTVIAKLKDATAQGVDVSVLSDYRRRVEEHASRSADLNESLTSRDAAKERLKQLRSLRLVGFEKGIATITKSLKALYTMITMGGNAQLDYIDTLDPFSEGIQFSVMPPKKSWKNISNLSGGEKTLSSLALVFALHQYKPTPLYVMDEIDAALDFRNVCSRQILHSCGGDPMANANRSQLSQAISRSRPRTRNLSSFRCGITCSNSRRDWSASTRSITW